MEWGRALSRAIGHPVARWAYDIVCQAETWRLA